MPAEKLYAINEADERKAEKELTVAAAENNAGPDLTYEEEIVEEAFSICQYCSQYN